MTSGDVGVGDILHFYSTDTTPRKDKLHVCVAPNCFFIINSLPNYPPTVPAAKADYPFLDYDSHICCSLLSEFDPQRYIPDDARRGRLTRMTAQAIIATLPNCRTLTKAQKDAIALALAAIR